MAVHNLTIPLLVGNGIPVSEAPGIEKAEVSIAPAYEFQRDDNTVNWGAVVTYPTSEASLTITGMVDEDAAGHDVVWLARVSFLNRGQVVSGGTQFAFIFAPSAPTDAVYPDDIVKQDVVTSPEYGPTWAQQAEAAKVAAQQAQVAAQGYAAAAQAVPLSNDTIIAGRINTPGSATATALGAAYGQLSVWARNPDQMFAGAISQDSNGAPTGAAVIWPDGAAGAYAADVVSTSFPPAVDSYHVTRVVSGVTKTYTQPLVTRDASGRVTTLPTIVVS